MSLELSDPIMEGETKEAAMERHTQATYTPLLMVAELPADSLVTVSSQESQRGFQSKRKRLCMALQGHFSAC